MVNVFGCVMAGWWGKRVDMYGDWYREREEEDNSDQAYAIRHVQAENSKPVHSRSALHWQDLVSVPYPASGCA